jgi:hypothetical protein
MYKLRTFDSYGGKMIYFNQEADVLYFGERNCTGTMIRVFIQASRNDEEILRVAMDVVQRCPRWMCLHDRLRYFQPFDTAIKLLHGLDTAHAGTTIDYHNQWSGCPGLREAFFVVKSDSLVLEAGNVDASIGFRTATTCGMTADQRSKYEEIASDMFCMRNGYGLLGITEYKWSNNPPIFRIVSFAPFIKRLEHRVLSDTFVTQEGMKRLKQKNWSFLKHLEIRTGCLITIPENPRSRERLPHIRFYGTEAEIEEAKQAV